MVATGDLFTTVMYPFIDVANGGTINGYIKALNAILDITVPSNVNEGGTMVIPGHGRLSDEQDVIEYRDMATIVRDRIREYVKRGMTLEQVKAKKPTLDFDPRYGSDTGFWTTAMFVETIYKQMVAANPPADAGAAQPAQTEAEGERGMSARLEARRPLIAAVACAGRRGGRDACAGVQASTSRRSRRRPRRRPWRAAAAAAGAARRRAGRSDRHLGLGRHRRLAVAHAHAAEGRLRRACR